MKWPEGPLEHSVEWVRIMNFSRFSSALSRQAGKPRTFLMACWLVVAWGISGPLFDFNDSWQLVINTGTTVVTFLMVFLIQHTQNLDNDSLHIKLDELLRATERAQNALINLDRVDARTLHELRKAYGRLGQGDDPDSENQELEARIQAARDSGKPPA